MIRTYNKLSKDANVFPYIRGNEENDDEHYYLWDDGDELAFDDGEIIAW